MKSPLNCGRHAAVLFIASLLAACNGTSSSNQANASASGQTTTLGTRASLSQPNPAVTDNADGAWADYSPPEDYPGVARLPLQFITLTSGPNAGLQLAVLVSVPADKSGNPAAGTFPAILMQDAYRIDASEAASYLLPMGEVETIGGTDTEMAQHGYVTVSVDVLGTGMSDGEATLFGQPEQDAYGDTVNWVLSQSWSNGNIGLSGASYLSIAAMLTAEQQNPAVKAVFAVASLGDAWRDIIGTGGLMNNLFVTSWMPLTQDPSMINGPAIQLHPQFTAQLQAATQEHGQAAYDFYIPTYQSALSGTVGMSTDDGDFWSIRSPVERASNIRVPVLIVGGTHDLFQRGEPLLYEQLKHNVTTKLIIMPGDHIQTIGGALAGADAQGEDGPPSATVLALQWFDKYLKGLDTGAENMPTVTQYVEGYGENGAARYASTTDWPHPLARPRRLYLHGDMTLSDAAPASDEETHTISEPASAPSEMMQAVIPGTPNAPMSALTALQMLDQVLSTSGMGPYIVTDGTPNDGTDCSVSYLQWTLGLGQSSSCTGTDDANVESVQQALLYETPTSSANLYINGPIEADIWMSSTVTAAALSVRVDDVAPDGSVIPLTNGLQSALYRAVDETRSRYIDGVMIQPWHAFTAASAQPIVPNQAMLVPVEIFPTAALIRSGHKLRVAISSSNQAQGVWTTPEQAEAAGGVSTIYNDADHPSSVVLPVVPTSALPGP